MIRNSFLQKVMLTFFWGVCAAGLIQFYKHMIWRANEDIDRNSSIAEIYGTARPANGAQR